MSRDLLHGDASFDWTMWHAAASEVCASGELRGLHRQILAEQGREDDYDATDADCDAQVYALALSSLGWCLRDAGALEASFTLGMDPVRWMPNCEGDPAPPWAEWFGQDAESG
jgi:hypothetical protein